jgi:outer membrane biosynthesis protein TonB
MKLSLSLVLFATACATTGTNTMDHEPPQRAKVQLDLQMSAADNTTFPALQEPRLRSVDRIAHVIREELGTEAVASIELCVAADGHVTRVALVEGTSSEAFNNALIRDIEQWQFAAMPGATANKTLQTCEHAKVKYLSPL